MQHEMTPVAVAGPDAPAPSDPAPVPSPVRPEAFTLSVLVPMFNEGPVAERFLDALESALTPTGAEYQVVCVDDGSTDDTLARLAARSERDRRIRVLSLTRNFGKEAALTAAIDHAEGDVAVAIDADLQHPPELIPELLARWREGYDVVIAVRRDRMPGGAARGAARPLFYRVFNMISEREIPSDGGDFRLLDRAVIRTLRTLPERNRFMKGLFAWVGFRIATVSYDVQPRAGGASHWRPWRLWNFALDGITGFSTVPLRMWSYLGLAIALVSLVYACWIVLRTLIWGIDVPGFASLIVLILFLGAVQLISLGVIGEYLGRVLIEVKRRPVYLIRARWGFGDDAGKGFD